MKLKTALALAMLVATPLFARAEGPTATGFWEAKDDDGNVSAWFMFTEKNNVYSARLVKGFKKPGVKIETICTKCTGDKKGAHIMGLTLFYGMKRQGLEYRGGSVLDPRDGSVYHAQMDLSEDGQDLSVRGYLGIPMLGKTQVWHRLPEDAMKKEEIPKEILAGGPAPSDEAEAADKPKHVEKKPHKAKDKKVTKTDEAPASPPADDKAEEPAK